MWGYAPAEPPGYRYNQNNIVRGAAPPIAAPGTRFFLRPGNSQYTQHATAAAKAADQYPTNHVAVG